MVVKTKKEIKEYYKTERVVEEYIKKRFDSAVGFLRHREQVKFINSLIKENSIKNVLEVACGPGRLTADIYGFKYGLAVDTSELMLKIAKERAPHWKFKKMDAFNLNLKKKFDLVISFRLLRHFKKEDRRRLYFQIKKILKPKGYFIFDAISKHFKILYKLRGGKVFTKYFSQQEIKHELEESGFKVLKIKPIVNHFLLQLFFSKLKLKQIVFLS